MKGPAECGEDWFVLPNMAPRDGIHLKFGRGGDLRWVQPHRGGQLHGIVLRIAPDGLLEPRECGRYDRGRLVEKWQDSMLPEGYVSQALMETAWPMKKALRLDLSPA